MELKLTKKMVIGLILLIAGLAVLSVGVVSTLSIISDHITVIDHETGLGIPGAAVVLSFRTKDTVPINMSDPKPPTYVTDGEFVFVTVGDYTDENGVAIFSFDRPWNKLITTVDIEGYTSNMSRYGYAYYDELSGYPPELIELYPGEPELILWSSGGDLTVEVVDTNGLGLEGASVYLFEDNIQVEMETTDNSGIVVFENLDGFYDVCVDAEGYTSDRSTDEYSYFGSAGVGQDLTYHIELSPVNIISQMGTSLTMIVGAVIACCGGAFIAYDKFVERN